MESDSISYILHTTTCRVCVSSTVLLYDLRAGIPSSVSEALELETSQGFLGMLILNQWILLSSVAAQVEAHKHSCGI